MVKNKFTRLVYVFSITVFSFLTVPIFATELDLSQMRDPKTIKDKINKGFDINAKRSVDGYTLLHYAAELGNADLTKFLITKGANTNVSMIRGNTPLSTAIGFDKTEIIKILLENGVDPNYQLGESDYLRSHFHYYMIKTRKFDPSIFNLFISKGANLESKDFFTETPLISTAALDFKSIHHSINLLNAGANINAQTKFGKTPLMVSVFIKHFALAQELIKRGTNIELEDSDGNTVLLAMINIGNDHTDKPKLFQILLNANANPNHQNKEGDTALHLSVIGNSLEILEILTKQNVDSSLRNQKGKTALDQAIINENWLATKILLKIEKNINGLDKYGSTMLHSAILNEKYELITLLMEAGADPQTKDKWGKSAFEFADKQNNPKVIKLLKKE
ncbi:ankyrin repeat domain-containing protein [Leptospira kanakyensis]|uniref:Ankyrin repeat domain-containing protein n=1 Tax=Leptospira kanakyensis TaxID=2484968 RepID=A0A6N4QDM3_9LEPT|nr:ankyrin repeat domain-containing protein [Leptospira kanakyensis]TGK50430.1 ankyrin repeat domain-containing protein [Leptospira kanakyensis]TGK63968.1 ankyrin repeat domain-containing protein [Leptospira kanakyensis]TGK69568.1 ankyrin repeat domain-containing protein [Leptospira kanakyensis]